MAHRELISEDKAHRHVPIHEHFIFEGIDYPATKHDLVDLITDAEADIDTMNLIRALPDRSFANRDDVWRAIAEATRVVGANRTVGKPRDDIGKQALMNGPGMLHP